MTTKRVTKIELFTIVSWLAPYIIILFFLRYTSISTLIGLQLLSGLFILGCMTILFLTKQTRYKKKNYLLTAALNVTLFVLLYGQLLNASDRIFFILHKSSMARVVTEIKDARRVNKQIEKPKLKFALVDILEDGTIIFTIDGMLDNCVGIAYSDYNINPGYTNCGRIIEWRKLDEHWYFWYTT